MQDPVLFNDWHPVAFVHQLAQRNPLPARVLGEDVVIWQAGPAGPIQVWQDLCIHRGTRLSIGKVCGAQLECPYHGWVFNDSGQCVRIPAHPDQAIPTKARAKTYQVTQAYGLVWVCLGTPTRAVPPFPEWDKPGFRFIPCGPYTVQASGPRVIENFLDVGHFPFVHEGILGVRARPEIADYEAEINADGVLAKNIRVFQPDGFGTGQGDMVEYTYAAFRPLTAFLRKESTGPQLSILLIITPVAPAESVAWMVMAMNYAHDAPERELAAFQDKIFLQDQPILQSQRPELLPLDLQAELHLKSDRTAIAYRKWLRDMGLGFGAN